MPPSQLKRLKASLREQGIVGPQQSKKQKKQNAQNGVHKEKRVHRTEALNTIRDQFNPFEYKWSKGPRFAATTLQNAGDSKGAIVGRPYASKSRAEEGLQNGLLLDRKNRRKVGGIHDRRFGENDPTMDPETRMLQRTTDLAQRRNRQSAFDLEDDEPGELTHMGQSLSLNGPDIKDDFEEDMSNLSDADDHPSDEENSRKRPRTSEDEEEDGDQEEGEERPERKKSKHEVMAEVVAKSKLYKYERQAAKDDDEDLREELDREFQDIHALLRGMGSKPAPAAPAPIAGMNPERAALLSGADKAKFNKEYDMDLKRMAMEKRSIPSQPTKTDAEIAEATAKKLQDLEEKRLRRMQGIPDSEDEDADINDNVDEDMEDDDFGFGSGIKAKQSTSFDVEDEDDFLIEDDLVASELGSDQEEDFSGEEGGSDQDEGEDAAFFKSLEEEKARPSFLTGANGPLRPKPIPSENGVNGDLAYTFKCPESQEELLEATKGVADLDLPTVVQRIRLQYDPKLKSDNKAKLGHFAVALVEHVYFLANRPNPPPFSVLETIIRHIHSMARSSYPVEISNAFRHHLKDIHESRALALTAGDLVMFTAIGTIYPTSDHFHQVVTSAILSMGRYLGLKVPQNQADYAMGAYLCAQCLDYQRVSKRYVPEVMNFIQNTLCALAPEKMSRLPGQFPYHEAKSSVRIEHSPKMTRTIAFYDCVSQEVSDGDDESLKLAILEANLKLLGSAADTWNKLPAFFEAFEPALGIVQHLSKSGRSKFPKTTQADLTKLAEKLTLQLQLAQLSRRPLELHHHRPLAIKMAIPKFEESYNPDKHYDPDRERSEAAKLRKEFKREKKGAVRDLRKEGKAVARENLKEKKEKDAAYEKKFKRLISEIQGEEGQESKAYEREKEWRKKGKK